MEHWNFNRLPCPHREAKLRSEECHLSDPTKQDQSGSVVQCLFRQCGQMIQTDSNSFPNKERFYSFCFLLRIGRVLLVQCFTSQFQTPLGDHTFFYRSEQDGLQTLQRHFALCSAANLKAEVRTVALLLIPCETRFFLFRIRGISPKAEVTTGSCGDRYSVSMSVRMRNLWETFS